MSNLMEVSRLFPQPTPPSHFFMEIDSFSKVQPSPPPAETPRKVGVYINKRQPGVVAQGSNEIAQVLAQFVITTSRRDTVNFIIEKGLASILLQSREHIEVAFGESVKTLSLVEDDEGHQTLFCLVMFRGTAAQAKLALSSLDQNWWLSQAGIFSAKLNFDFELV